MDRHDAAIGGRPSLFPAAPPRAVERAALPNWYGARPSVHREMGLGENAPRLRRRRIPERRERCEVAVGLRGCVVHGNLSGHSTKRSFGLKTLGASLLAFGMEPPFPMFPPGPSDVGVLDDAVEPAAFRAWVFVCCFAHLVAAVMRPVQCTLASGSTE
jgi:hypothetical protein